MNYSARIGELVEEAGKYIRANARASAGMATPSMVLGHMEIAMRKLANEMLEDCAELVHDRLGADGYGVAKMIRDRKVGD